jgi:hypothetical protein
LFLVPAQHLCRGLAKDFQLGSVDIISIALRKTEQEYAALGGLERDQRTKTAGATLAWPRNTFDHSASEIGIDETALGASHSVTEGVVGEVFLPLEPRKTSRLEDPHFRAFM